MKAKKWSEQMWTNEINTGLVEILEISNDVVEIVIKDAATPGQKLILQSLAPALAIAATIQGVEFRGTTFKDGMCISTYADGPEVSES